MVDKPVLLRKVAAVRDAVARIREVLPPDARSFMADRTVREVVLLNLFVGLQECLALATHWLADEGWDVPQSYRDVFLALGERGILSPDLALRLAGAAGLRNLVAHHYGVLDWSRVHAIAAHDLGDLESFCAELARRLDDPG